MKNKHIIFITGASGVGKTTLANQLEQKYADDTSVAVVKFDSIGVPSVEEMTEQFGSPSEWQRAMTKEWVRKMVKEMNESLIILDGQINLDFIEEACSEHNFTNYKMILIDCDVDVMCKRLSEERGQPELANDDMRNWLKFLGHQAAEKGATVIDTTNLNKQVVLKVFEEIVSKNVQCK